MAIEFQRSIFTTVAGRWLKFVSQNQERRLMTVQSLTTGGFLYLLINAPGPLIDQFGTSFDRGLLLAQNQVLMMNWSAWGRAICEDWYVFDSTGNQQMTIMEGINNP